MENMILAYPALAAMTVVGAFLALAVHIEAQKQARLAAAKTARSRGQAARRPALQWDARSDR